MKNHTIWERPSFERATWSRVMMLATILLSFVFTLIPFNRADAAALTTAYIRMSRQQASVVTGISLTAFWKPASTATENKFKIIFPDVDDGLWCRTNGSLTFATTTIDSASDPTPSAGTCTAGVGGGTFDTFDFTTADLTPATLYGVVITGNTAVIGTAAAGPHVTTMTTRTSAPADIDTLNVSLRTIADDQIGVTATVDPTLTVALTPMTTIDLGTLSSTQVNQVSMTSLVSTNAPNGYVSTVLYSGALAGPASVPDAAGGNIAVGSKEFGASTDDSTGPDLATTTGSCATGGAGPYNATALTTSAQTFATETAAIAADTTTLCLLAADDGTLIPGAYTTTITLVTTAKY